MKIRSDFVSNSSSSSFIVEKCYDKKQNKYRIREILNKIWERDTSDNILIIDKKEFGSFNCIKYYINSFLRMEIPSPNLAKSFYIDRDNRAYCIQNFKDMFDPYFIDRICDFQKDDKFKNETMKLVKDIKNFVNDISKIKRVTLLDCWKSKNTRFIILISENYEYQIPYYRKCIHDDPEKLDSIDPFNYMLNRFCRSFHISKKNVEWKSHLG